MTTTVRSPMMAPGRLPVLGHALQMMRRPREFLLSLQSGEAVTIVRLGREPAYVINDPKLIRQVLRDPETFGKGGPITERFRLMFGNGLGIADGDFHRRQRSLIQPAFHHTRIVRHASLMSSVTAAKVDSWRDGQRLAVDKEMGDLALTNVTKAMFSADTTVDRAQFLAATAVVLGGLFKRVMDTTGLLTRLPTPGNRRYEQAADYLRRTINHVISDYRASGIDHGDLLSMMLLARGDDGEQSMSDQQLHDEVMTIFIAGAESISNTLTWAFHELATHPEIEQRLHVEIDEVLAGRPAEYRDIAYLEYTSRVITETLRMRTQGWALSRFTLTATELGGYYLPAGASILYSPHALNHNPAIHPNPERFDPDRWLPERAKAIPRGAFIPFGMGNHTCIGEQFARTEMVISLATVAARWRLLSVPGHLPRPKFAFTMPVNALPMTTRRRQI
jgi:cyclooctat-9-en-7-ol 5-monooxygenase